MRSILGVATALLIAAGTFQPASAGVLGGTLDYTGGTVTVTSRPVTSGFVSELRLYDSSLSSVLYLMNDEPAGVTVSFDPGTYGFSIGEELIFGIRITSGDAGTPSGTEFFMGSASRNPDGIAHAILTDLGGGTFDVGFEDILGGGDLDFDDNVFRFVGGIAPTPVPEPGTAALLGLTLIGFARRRRAR